MGLWQKQTFDIARLGSLRQRSVDYKDIIRRAAYQLAQPEGPAQGYSQAAQAGPQGKAAGKQGKGKAAATPAEATETFRVTPWQPQGVPAAVEPKPAPTEDPQMQELWGALRASQQALPPLVAEALAKMEGNQGRMVTKSMHAHTKTMGSAKKQIHTLREARRKQDASWVEFLNNTVLALEQGAKRYQEAMQKFEEQETEARTRLTNARQAIRELAGKMETEEPNIVDDAEDLDDSDIELMDTTQTALTATTEESKVVQAQKKLRVTLDALMSKRPPADPGKATTSPPKPIIFLPMLPNEMQAQEHIATPRSREVGAVSVGTLSEPTVGNGKSAQAMPKLDSGFPAVILGQAAPVNSERRSCSSLHSQGRLALSAAQLRLCQDAASAGPGDGKYSVFDRHRHHEVRKSIPTWAASDYLNDAIASCAEATICAQFLQPPIPDLPVPQITLTPPGWPLGSLSVAIDARKVGGTICTVVLTPGCEKLTVLDAIATECPTLAPVLNFAVAQDAVFLLDSAGRIWEVLPLQLDTLQWLSLQLDVTGVPHLHSSLFLGGMVGSGPTTLTSTAAIASSSSSAPPTVTFILVGGGTLIRLAPQPWMHASVLDSLTELLFVLALQGRMPHRPLLQISAASPRVPARLNTYFICFLIYPEGPDIHVLEDFSVDGHMRAEASQPTSMALHIRQPTANWRQEISSRSQGDYFAEVETPSRLYELLPQLRYFALPVPVPHMQALAADPLSATLQVRAKESLRRTLQLRIDDRQRHFGTFARSNQPIVVLGPGHPALSLYMDQPLTPGFDEAVEFLQNGEYLPAGTTFRDPLVLEWTTPVFISVPPGSTRRTLLYPSPHSPHFLQVSVPPNLPLAGLPLPVRRGKRAVFPPDTESEHVIEEKPLPPARRASADASSGTSLLQISAELRQVRIPTLSRRTSCHFLTLCRAPGAFCHWRVTPGISCVLPSCPAEHLDAVLVYTDGSFDPKARRASWSFVAVGKQGSAICRLGALAGRVSEPATAVNAFRAELWALLQAVAFIIANNLQQVTLAVDCQAALDVAFGNAQAAAQDPIGLAVQSLLFFARTMGLQVKPWKVEAHSGIPLNEAADAVAKTANGCWIADGFHFDDSVLRSCIDDGTVHRLWLTSCTGRLSAQLPPLDNGGCWNLPSCQLRPATEAATSSIHSETSAPKNWKLAFSVITYNCLSARSRPARALLDAGLQASQCAIAGLQEARDPTTGISSSDHYWIATSGCDAQGSYGCQIWISKTRAWGHSSDTALKPVRDSFSLFHAEPRLLVLLIRVGRIKCACVSAHAPTTAAGTDASRNWWAHLRATCNRIPPGHTLLLMVDANAAYDRFGPNGDTLESVPCSENAKQFQQFCDAVSLQPTAQVDRLGHRLVSWTSPDGQTQKLLDYVCVPAAWRTRLSAAPNFCLGDLREGYDHSPIMGSVVATVCAPSTDTRPRFSPEALRTADGRKIAAAALASAPPVPWEVDATTHLEVLLGHVQRFLAKHLPPPPPRPRNPVLSDMSLRLILTRRQVRTVKKRLAMTYARGLLFQCFAAWSGRAELARSQANRLDRLSCRLARAGFALSALHKGIGESFRADKAQFTRRAMETARGRGAAEFAHSIRAILRTGRRFRAPQLLHQISDGNSTAVCEEEILKLLGEHFAKPERARQITGGALAKLFNEVQPPTHKIDMTSLPSIADIASATLALKKGKAPGMSGVPAELFQADALATAELLFPILAKSVVRCSGPLQHNGGLARAIPKSKQQAGSPAGWRSILLLEPTGKILQKAYRTQLVLALEQHKSKNQFGGLPHRRIEDASVMVRAHFARLKAHRQTGGALFIDSRAAYYSLVRDSLVRSQTLQTEDQLYQRARALFPFRDDQDHYVRHMQAGGLIPALQLPEPLVRYLESQLGTTWFSMEAPSQAPYVSGSGTAPGSPIADLLFSFVYARFLQHVEEILLAEGHYVTMCSTADASIMPTWADDTAVLVGPVAPPLLAASLQRVTDLLTRGLSRAGLDPNFGPGKTEAVIHFEGPGSRDTRRQLLCLVEPGVQFDSHLRGTLHLRLVPTYVHLGTVVSHNLSEEPNLQHRAHLLKQLFQPLRRRLLYNDDLTKQEKIRLLEERVFPKFLFGAGFWTPRNTREHDMALDPLRCAMRQAFRPITGVSSTGYCNQEVAAALGLPTADDCLAHARATTLLHLLKTGSREVWHGLLADGLWYQLSWEALRTVLGEAWPVALCTTAPPPPEQLQSLLPNHCDKLCRNYLRKCKQNHASVALQPRCAEASEVPAITRTLHSGLTHTCGVCGLSFLNARRLAVHKARKHQQRAKGIQLAWGTRCERCGTEFWNTSRLAQHLQHSATCQSVYDHSDTQPACVETPSKVPLAWLRGARCADCSFYEHLRYQWHHQHYYYGYHDQDYHHHYDHFDTAPYDYGECQFAQEFGAEPPQDYWTGLPDDPPEGVEGVGAENLEEAAEAVEMYAGGEDDRPERGPHNGSWKTACLSPAPPLDLSEWFEEHIARAEEDAKAAVLGRLGRLPYRREVLLRTRSNQRAGPGLCLVTQCSLDRLDRLRDQLCGWAGEVSAAVFVDHMQDSEAAAAARRGIRDMCFEAAMQFDGNVPAWTITVLYRLEDADVKCEAYDRLYPVNALRNVALEHARSDLVFLVDVDFVPSRRLHEVLASDDGGRRLLNALSHGSRKSRGPGALVIPAFEAAKSNTPLPLHGVELRHAAARGEVEGFHVSHFPCGHRATDFDRWLGVSKVESPDAGNFSQHAHGVDAYLIHYEEHFEPYVVVPRQSAPAYDERFRGYGLNKISHLYELSQRGFRFRTCAHPEAFVVAAKHPKSQSWHLVLGPQAEAEQRARIATHYATFKAELKKRLRLSPPLPIKPPKARTTPWRGLPTKRLASGSAPLLPMPLDAPAPLPVAV
ncbi:Large2 [Symbiodinium sp. KB8]|nr:Large2 [Symbiodinium sp. KB8]